MSDYFDRVLGLPAESVNDAQVPEDVLPRVGSLTGQALLVETLAASQAARVADESRRRDRWLAGIGIGVALLVMLGAGLLSILVARSIARPLRRLTASADEVADVAQQELVRVADTEDPQAAAPGSDRCRSAPPTSSASWRTPSTGSSRSPPTWSSGRW